MELSGLTRHVPVWHLTVLSLVSFFQVKLTGTFPDHEAPGHPIEATLSGLLCVGHSASHFVSTTATVRTASVPLWTRSRALGKASHDNPSLMLLCNCDHVLAPYLNNDERCWFPTYLLPLLFYLNLVCNNF